MRAVNKISNVERDTKETDFHAELIDGLPSGTIGMILSSSIINGDLFIDGFSHFIHHIKPTKDQPIPKILEYNEHSNFGTITVKITSLREVCPVIRVTRCKQRT